MSRKLGQHFLINKTAIKKIIAALDLQPQETVIEIGPGKGALTLPLAERCQESSFKCHVIAIEKDEKMAERLSNSEGGRLNILTGDALKLLPELTTRYTLHAKPYKIVGNIPYYITGKLLRILSELENKPKFIVLTIQREVAERITAKQGKMNLLAAATQIWAEPEIIGYLKPSDFSPPPKVNSAITTFNLRRSQGLRLNDEQKYYQLIRIIFKQPRKTLLNNLSAGLKITKEETLKYLNLIGMGDKSRPQDLSISQILELNRSVYKFL